MKMVRQSRQPTFSSQNADVGGIRQRKAMAMGKQGPVSTIKNPGSKGSRIPGMKKK
jgi:hypothetical protein